MVLSKSKQPMYDCFQNELFSTLMKPQKVSTSLGNSKSMDKGDSSYMNMVDDDFPRDITILTSESEVQTKEFKRATTTEGIYNHHNVFMDVSKPPLSVYGCSDPKLQQKSTSFPFSLLAGGATETAISQFSTNKGDVKAGYYLSKTRIIITIVDVVNYKNETQDIYTVTDLEYLLGKPEGYLDSNQQRIDPGICGGPQGSAIHAPAGVSKFSINSTGIIMKESGWILNSFAHMHDGGVNIVLKINDKVMCDSRALYGGDGFVTTTSDGKVWETIRETTKCVDPIPVRKGDRMDMQANYDTDLHPRSGIHSYILVWVFANDW
jgi:hypothetical protein